MVPILFQIIQAYVEEEAKQQKRIQKLESEGADLHDIRKQREVLAETVDIIPDCKMRLEKAHKALEEAFGLLGSYQESGNEDYCAAAEMLSDLKKASV